MSIRIWLATVGAAGILGAVQPAEAIQEIPGTERLTNDTYVATPRPDEGPGPAPIPSAGPVPHDPSVEANMRSQVNIPDGFELTLFTGPEVALTPVCVTEAPDGAIYVCSDPNSSLSRIPAVGRVVRLVDDNHDGRADRYTTFAELDSPRGIASDGETVYVMHSPHLTAFRDTNGDGAADWSQTLVSGLGRDLDFRGADHTTNAIKIGSDGWIYIAVGDYGFMRAVGTDGTAIQCRCGGVVRVRPDGTNLELYATGTRNKLDVGIDPFMNVFSRDNDDDGGGWNTRLLYIPPGAFMGFPTHYRNFRSEHFPYLSEFESGSGVGTVWLQDPSWPEPYNNTLLTADWTVHKVQRHPLTPRGASFDVENHDFIDMIRPAGIAMDSRSGLLVTSLSGGGYRFTSEPVGYVFRVAPTGVSTQPPAPGSMSDAEIVGLLRTTGYMVHRQYAQFEILRRGESAATVSGLEQLIRDTGASAESRVAAMFTVKQLIGVRANPILAGLVTAPDWQVRASALRALADRKDQLAGVDAALFVSALSDPHDHVKVQALNGLVRLGAVDAAPAILPLTAASDQGLAHLAVNAVAELGAVDAALHAVDTGSPNLRAGALRALGQMHQLSTVKALLSRLDDAHEDRDMRMDLLTTLARLYNREGPWAGDWWTTRPANIGPYFAPAAWEASPWVRPVLRQALLDASGDELEAIADALVLNRVLPRGAQPLLATLQAERDPLFDELVGAMVGRLHVTAEQVPVLVQLSERSHAHKLAVAQLLTQQGDHTKASIPLLRSAAMDEGMSDEIRAALLNAIGLIPAVEGTEAAAPVFAEVNPEIGAEIDSPVDSAWRRWVGNNRRGQELGFFIELVDAPAPQEQILAYAVLLQRTRGNVQQAVLDEVLPVLNAAWSDPGRASLLASAVRILRLETEYTTELENVSVTTP